MMVDADLERLSNGRDDTGHIGDEMTGSRRGREAATGSI